MNEQAFKLGKAFALGLAFCIIPLVEGVKAIQRYVEKRHAQKVDRGA